MDKEVLEKIIDWIPLLLPLFIVQTGLLLFAVIDLAKKRRTKNLTVLIWVIVICFINTIGPVLYFILGRAEAADPDGKDEDDKISGG